MSSGASQRLQDIRKKHLGNTGKKVLLVEGEDDADA